jgi:enoyl-[acyl-carrier-protein] reductase (NADH)
VGAARNVRRAGTVDAARAGKSAIHELFMAMIPMKRAVEAEEIAATAVFLASEHARSINGETIAIDGGSLTRGYPALLTGLKA